MGRAVRARPRRYRVHPPGGSQPAPRRDRRTRRRRGARADDRAALDLHRSRPRARARQAIHGRVRPRHPNAVHLADQVQGATTRFCTRQVLETEEHVLRAADGLARNGRHQVGDRILATVLSNKKFDGISREQARACRHATAGAGLALIDGQAGTGKSFTMAAIREASELQGYKEVGLAPTNAVARDMACDGFARTGTVHSELLSLDNDLTRWDRRIVIMVDEAATIDTRNMAILSAHACAAGAKLILVGDDRQLSSIERGGMFGVIKDCYGAAELAIVRRQHKHDDRRAAEMMAEGNFDNALCIYQAKGAIQWTRNQPAASSALVTQWAMKRV